MSSTTEVFDASADADVAFAAGAGAGGAAASGVFAALFAALVAPPGAGAPATAIAVDELLAVVAADVIGAAALFGGGWLVGGVCDGDGFD